MNQPQAELAECCSQLGECRAEFADFYSHFAADLARRRGQFAAAEGFLLLRLAIECELPHQ